MTTNDERIKAAFASDNFNEVTKDVGVVKVVQILNSFFECDPLTQPTRRVTDIERRHDPITRGAESLWSEVKNSGWGKM